MSDQTTVAPESPLDLLIELPLGVPEVSYPKGLKINQVKLKGMRNKPAMLLRVPWEDIVKMDQYMRGIPCRYAIEYRRHVIRLWPAARTDLTLIVDKMPFDDELHAG